MSTLLSFIAILSLDSPRPVIPNTAGDVFIESYSKAQRSSFQQITLASGHLDADYHLDKLLVFGLSDPGKVDKQKRGTYIVAFLTVGLVTSGVLFIPETEIHPDSINGWEDNGYGRISINGKRCIPVSQDPCELVSTQMTLSVEEGFPKIIGARYGENPRFELSPEQ